MDSVIFDELGYLPFSQAGGALLFTCCPSFTAIQCPGKPYCSVRQWILVELDISEAKKASVIEQGFQPLLLYAHNVVTDSARRFAPGDGVKSTFLVELKNDYLFETNNSVYILWGAGSRKIAAPDVVTSIF